MPRSVVVLFTSVVLGLSAGLGLWLFVGTLNWRAENTPSVPKPPEKQAAAPAKIPPPRETAPSPPDTQIQERQTAPEPDPATVPEPVKPETGQPGPAKPPVVEPADNLDQKPEERVAEKKPAAVPPAVQTAKAETKSAPPAAESRTRSYPVNIGQWRVSRLDDGCVATLPARGEGAITNLEQPESVGLYLFHAKSGSLDEDGPDRYGFVAPGRGEMSAKLTTAQGAYVRGVNSNTGLIWSNFVQDAQRDMDLELTACSLDGVCRTYKKKLDIPDLQAAAAFTFQCTNDN